MKAHRIALTLVALFALASLSGCALDSVAARQGEMTGLWEELTGPMTFGQSFVSTSGNLYRIDLSTATYARTNSAPVIFHLRSSPTAGSDIYSTAVPGPEIQNDRPTSFLFPPLPDSRGRSYYFFIESPGSEAGNAITVYANENEQYAGGTAYRTGEAVPGDLAFTAYSRETFSFARVWGDFLAQAGSDLPFCLCYGLLILGACTGLAWVLCRRDRFTSPRG